MMPFIPHVANECLELLNCDSTDKWPTLENNFKHQTNIAVQINGKTRDTLAPCLIMYFIFAIVCILFAVCAGKVW